MKMRGWMRAAAAAVVGSLSLAASASAQTAFLSEILVNSPGADNGFEFIEIQTAVPGTPLAGHWLLVIEGDGTGAGVVDIRIDLSAHTTGANGLLLLRDAAAALVPAPDAATTVFVSDFNPDLENGSITFILGTGVPPAAGADLDSDNDGTLNAGALTGFVVLDAIAWLETDGAANVGYADDLGFLTIPQQSFTPDAVYRVLSEDDNSPLIWVSGDLLGSGQGPFTWNPDENYNWDIIGVDPTTKTLDAGVRNFKASLPESPGACCLASGMCVEVTAGECATQGGIYQGDGSLCALVLCPQPTGSCCLLNGTCVDAVTALDCTTMGGIYNGNGTMCGAINCQGPTGSCCFGDGTCQELDEGDCATAGGIFGGVGSTCLLANCQAATPGAVTLSEIFVNIPGTNDGLERIELAGPETFNYFGWWLITLEGDCGSGCVAGTVDQRISLNGAMGGANGLLVVRDGAQDFSPSPSPDTGNFTVVFTPDLENGAVTYILGYGNFNRPVGFDLDADNDGTIDAGAIPSGFTVVDAVSYLEADIGTGVEYADEFGTNGTALGRFLFDPENPPAGFTPDALYRIYDANNLPMLWAGGTVLGDVPGPFGWDAAENFGFTDVGLDPSTMTLDIGLKNVKIDDGDECPCDWDTSGAVDSSDFFDFLADFFAGDADYNNSGGTDSSDFFDFLACFFAGCP